MKPGPRTSCPSDRLVAFLIFLAAGSLFAATQRGFLSFDEETMFLVTEGLWERQDVAIEGSLLRDTLSYPGRDGRNYSWYDIGQSLLGIPFYGAGKVAAHAFNPNKAPFITRFAVGHTGALFGALAVAMFFLVARRLGARPGRSALVAILLAASTPLWFYSRTFYRAPELAFCLITCTYFLFGTRTDNGGGRSAFLAGTALGLAVLIKFTSIAWSVPALFYLWQSARPRSLLGPVARAAGLFLIPVAVTTAMVFWYTHYRFGYWLPQAPSGTESFVYPLLMGVWGHLFSPGRGMFIFAPILWGLFAYVPAFRRRSSNVPAELVFLLLVSAIHLTIHAKWSHWHGGSCWGPRYMIPIFPLLLLFFAFPLRNGTALRTRPLLAVSCGIVIGFSLVIQAAGVLGEGRPVGVKRDPAFSELVFYPDYSTGLSVGSLLQVGDLRWERRAVAVDRDAVHDPVYRELLVTSPSVWWAFLWRMGFPTRYLVPAFVELLALTTALWLLWRRLSRRRKHEPPLEGATPI